MVLTRAFKECWFFKVNVHELDESILETLERELEITLEGCRHLETKSSQIEVCSSSKSASNDHFHVFTPDLGAEKWAQETREKSTKNRAAKFHSRSRIERRSHRRTNRNLQLISETSKSTSQSPFVHISDSVTITHLCLIFNRNHSISKMLLWVLLHTIFLFTKKYWLLSMKEIYNCQLFGE